jgi:hypothetical protein
MSYAAKRQVTERVDPSRDLPDKVTAVIELTGKVYRLQSRARK